MASSKWDIEQIPDQSGKVIIVTGATSGLGKQATQVLAGKNATVIMAVRNTEKAAGVRQAFLKANPNAKIEIAQLDLSNLQSVEAFAADFNKQYDRLDVLINNAGVMMCPYSKTADGFEIQMGTNHFGHFALTGHLMPKLRATAGSRVVATSSMAHIGGNIDFQDINWENRDYNTSRAYGDSKIANLYFTYEFARKYKDDPQAPRITAAHPGWTTTELQRHAGNMNFLNRFFGQDVSMGVLPTLRAAYDPEAQAGDYFGPKGFMEMGGHPKKVRSNKRSQDQAIAEKLWTVSEEMTGVKY